MKILRNTELHTFVGKNMREYIEGKFLMEMKKLTHVSFIFEGELTPGSSAMKMSCALAKKRTIAGPAFLSGPISLETFLNYGRIFSMIIRVHLYITSGNIYLVATLFNAMIMCLFSVMRTSLIAVATIIHRAVSHETVL